MTIIPKTDTTLIGRRQYCNIMLESSKAIPPLCEFRPVGFTTWEPHDGCVHSIPNMVSNIVDDPDNRVHHPATAYALRPSYTERLDSPVSSSLTLPQLDPCQLPQQLVHLVARLENHKVAVRLLDSRKHFASQVLG